MKIVVCIKAVSGYIASPQVSEAGDRVNGKFGPVAINESDEYAVEAAVAFKNAVGGEVLVISAGPLSCQQVLYQAVAKGADRAVRVDADLADSDRIATVLAAAVQQLGFDLIVTGVESSDNMAARVGQSLAERLSLPFVYSATELKPGQKPGTIIATKELGGGVKQVLSVSLPALVCLQSGTAPLSYIPVRKLLQARGRALDCLTVEDLSVAEKLGSPSPLRITEVFYPQKGSRAEIIAGKPAEVASVLIKKIREET